MFKIITKTIVAASCLFAVMAMAQTSENGTEQVLNHHLQSFGEGNIEAILSDYTDHSVVIVPNGVLEGKEQIKGLFDALVGEFSKPGTQFELTDTKIEGPLAYITWQAETQDNVYSFATDTFVIIDGKIAYQTIAFVATAKN